MPLKVLVVDDHADTLDLLTRVLERWGHFHVIAHSTAEAQKMATGLRFDVLLCDYQLGDGTCDVLGDLRNRIPHSRCGNHWAR